MAGKKPLKKVETKTSTPKTKQTKINRYVEDVTVAQVDITKLQEQVTELIAQVSNIPSIQIEGKNSDSVSSTYRSGYVVTIVECMSCKQIMENHTKMFVFTEQEVEQFMLLIHKTFVAQQKILCANPELIGYRTPVLVNIKFLTKLQSGITLPTNNTPTTLSKDDG